MIARRLAGDAPGPFTPVEPRWPDGSFMVDGRLVVANGSMLYCACTKRWVSESSIDSCEHVRSVVHLVRSEAVTRAARSRR